MTISLAWYDHYYLNCGEFIALDNLKQETPPIYYSLLDEENWLSFTKVET